MPQKMAASKGYVQNLWLHGPEHYLTEVGTMNMFVVFKQADGSMSFSIRGDLARTVSLINETFTAMELVTPPLDGMILPGVTRDSVLELARTHISGKAKVPELTEKLVVSERPVTMKEVIDAGNAGQLVELFGTGNKPSQARCEHTG
jgi:branched-chain amino acid aminotransferase